MRRVFPWLLALVFASNLAAFARTAAATPVATPHATSELVAETAGGAPGSTVWVAVVQTLDKGWHTYWRNPGDAGEATTITWALPAGWRAGAIVWPTPRRLPVGPIMNYGHEGRVVLPVPIQIPASAKAGGVANLSAVVNYLVCADICVPGSATVTLPLPITSGAPAPDRLWGPVIAKALASAPKPGLVTATFQRTGRTVKLAAVGAPLAGAVGADAYFYPYDPALIDHGSPQTLDRGLRGVTLALAPGAAFKSGATPTSADGVLTLDGRAYEVNATPGSPPPGAAGLGPAKAPVAVGSGLPLAVAFAFLGGLILNLMPCVFPILAMKAAALAAHSAEPRAGHAGALAFLGGVLVAFLLLAGALIAARAAGSAVGWGFQLQSPIAVGALALVMLAAALNLSGLYEIGTSVQGLGAGLAARRGLAGSAFTGLLAVVVAAPCTAPFMGPALGYALTQPPAFALVVFVALGLGFAAPFTLLAFSPGLVARLPRPGPWMDIFRKALAFPMYAAAAWLAWVLTQQAGATGLGWILAAAVALAFAAWLFGIVQRRRALAWDMGAVAAAAAAGLALAVSVGAAAAGALGVAKTGTGVAPTATRIGALPSQAWSPDALAALRAQGRPVLVNFTAAWCVTCQVNERLAFSSGDVARAFRRDRAAYLVADWTNRDPAIAQALGAQGRIGVPLYLLYGADGAPPRILPQLLTGPMVANALDLAAKEPARS